jgi:hypothetical protein
LPVFEGSVLGTCVFGGATGAHEASLLIGCFIQLATEALESFLLPLLRRFTESPRLGLALLVLIASNPDSPVACPFSKATHSLPSELLPLYTILGEL